MIDRGSPVRFGRPSRRQSMLSLVAVCCAVSVTPAAAETPVVAATVCERLILVTVDGLRPQEFFGGADARLMDEEQGVKDLRKLRERFWRESTADRRVALLPFLAGFLESQGVVLGNADLGSHATVLNAHRFSYPGYNEILTGIADPRIDSNDKRPNPNMTVLEWLHRQEGFAGRVKAFASWDVFPFIINEERSGIPVNAGWQPLADRSAAHPLRPLDELASELPHYWENVRYDYFTFRGALDCLQREDPKVLFVGFGETDDWAHAGRYDLYLDAAFRTDGYIRRLWETSQADPAYAGKTAVLITTDHGRGDTREGWKSHGSSIPGSEQIWIAALGCGVDAAATRQGTFHQAQVAATAAALLGFSYTEAQPDAATPLVLSSKLESVKQN